jgi:hypothetical protein
MLCCTAHDSVVGKAQNEPGQREHNASFGLNPHGSSDRSRIAVIRTWNGCYRQGNGPRDWIRPGRRKLLPRHPVGIVRGVCFGILRLWRVAYLALGSVVQQGSAKTRPEGFNCRRGAVEGLRGCRRFGVVLSSGDARARGGTRSLGLRRCLFPDSAIPILGGPSRTARFQITTGLGEDVYGPPVCRAWLSAPLHATNEPQKR